MKSQLEVVTEGATAAAHDRPLATTLANQEVVTFLSSTAAAESSQPDLLPKDQFAATKDRAKLASIVEKKRSTAVMKPDVGILGKNFLKNKGQEQPIDKQFAIHRKKRAATAIDVDVGILSNNGIRRHGGQQQTSRANLHAMNELAGRSLQSEGELPYMCPGKDDYGGLTYFDNLFDETDGYFPTCSCSRVSPTTCGPDLCECLELDADGDILQCMDPFNQLCQGTMYIDGIPGPWSMEKCLGSKSIAITYCSHLPCFVDGGSMWQCRCNYWDSYCTEYRYAYSCAVSKCCQAQTDEEGRKACFYYGGGLYKNYYDQVSSFSISYEEMISRFNECSFNSDSDKSIVQCYCESFSYGRCVNVGVGNPDYCEAMNCCFGETEDDARLNCFTTRFRTDGFTGWKFYYHRDTIQEGCVATGRSSDQCKCDVQGLSNCVFGIDVYDKEPRCDLFQCCQSQTDDDDEGRKDCLVQDEAQLVYEKCINDANRPFYPVGSTDACVCDKSKTLCSSGHSNDQHCELSSCCQESADDTGRKECIGNFTTSQPSSAPSETPTEDSRDEAEASPTAASALPGTSSASIPTLFGAKSPTKATSRMLAVTAAVISWLLFT